MKIVLVETESSGNIGSVCRIMKNFGYKKLYLLNPQCDIDEESRKMACNAQDILHKAKIITNLNEVKAKTFIGTSALKGGEYNILRNYTPIKDIRMHKDAAIVFGSESQGLSTELLELMDFMTTIPTNPKYPTLNISHALGIILYEIQDQIVQKTNLASKEQKNRLTELFLSSMNQKDMNEHEIRTARLAFSKLISRAEITNREIQALFGSFRRI